MWKIESALYGSNELNKLLEEGWEPFAIVDNLNGIEVYVRHLAAHDYPF